MQVIKKEVGKRRIPKERAYNLGTKPCWTGGRSLAAIQPSQGGRYAAHQNCLSPEGPPSLIAKLAQTVKRPARVGRCSLGLGAVGVV